MTKSHLVVFGAIAGLFAWVFAEALFGGGMFVFRDAGHYFYPLFQFLRDEWLAGRVPLWNPYENLGVPLAGNASSSVFYPGTLVFLLPIDYGWAYKLYVMAHVLLAAWTAYRLARHWQASVEASGVAALSYAFSGNVLFQCCNVIFLVGAAWLPAAVLAADRALRPGASGQPRASTRWAVLFGVVLAMMTLGGNAEMAYHAGLLAAMYALWLWWHETGICKGPLLRKLAGSRLMLLALAAATGLALSAVQVIPSIEFVRLSTRAISSVPRAIYEVPGHLLHDEPGAENVGRRWTDGLACRRLERGSHHEHVYHFSVGPWRLAEYVWPNIGGRQFPVHRRWLEVIPGEGRIWVPSLYAGLVPIVLALAAMRLRRADARTTWLSWMVVLAVVGSFGWYGLGWIVAEIRAAVGPDRPTAWLVGEPFGGLYWLMTVLLPGYVYFRYPAKLLVIAALGLSMLAARGWDRAFGGSAATLRRGLLWLAGVSLLGAGVALGIRPFWHGWLAGVQPDVLFGPLDTTGAANDLLAALLETTVVSALLWWLLGLAGHRGEAVVGGARWPAMLAIGLVAVDLGVANGWMVACAPSGQWEQKGKLADILGKQEGRRSEGQPYRVWRQGIWTPPSWRSSSSATRLSDAARWDRDSLWPKYNLASRIALAQVQGTMMPYDYDFFVRTATWKKPRFIAEYLVLRAGDRPPGAVPVEFQEDEPGQLEDVSVWRNPQPLPRAWIVHQVDELPPLASDDPEAIAGRTESVLLADGRPRDLAESAVVEADRGLDDSQSGPPGPASAPPGAESCRVVHYDPLRVEIEAVLARPGLVILCDQFYPGWRLDVETKWQGRARMPILRTNRVMRGAWLPAGEHRLVYRYRPTSFFCGTAISGLAWVALGVTVLLAKLRAARPGRKARS